jgi:hypothetical protein
VRGDLPCRPSIVAEVAELEIERSGFGLIDHCTGGLRFHGGAAVDRAIPCR